MTNLLLALAENVPLSDQIRHPIYFDHKRRMITFSEKSKFVIILPVSDFTTGDGYWRFINEEETIKKSNELARKGRPHQIIDKEGFNYYKAHRLNGGRCLRVTGGKELIFDNVTEKL